MSEQPGASAPTPPFEPEARPEPLGAPPVGPAASVALPPVGPAASVAYPTPPVGDAFPLATPPVGDAPNPPRRKRRLLRWLGWSTAGLGVLALVGLSAYLVVVSQQWSDRVDELTAISEDLGQSVADARAAQADAEARMDTARVELENATARISDLANEEAQAKDRESVLIGYVDAALSCADSRQEVIDVLTDPGLIFQGKSNAQVEREVTAYCNEVTSGFATFKEEIGQ
ncbi:hypothetical protein LGT39_06980 [Demequina sp. TTPB684]|uniref:hypothetical protein n=1 Tax=unclassified Demequina TaxID=2620311 RepID=UPI001CF26359|nr:MULTISPECIES: hypothetical protein [unclassified Demequina]MCB2412592.1 hypothetical protein [Demequina sp. TTPB684]UPU89541.1 hypothetical protein LGT36_006335 [Demequina sp. TMPB413]